MSSPSLLARVAGWLHPKHEQHEQPRDVSAYVARHDDRHDIEQHAFEESQRAIRARLERLELMTYVRTSRRRRE